MLMAQMDLRSEDVASLTGLSIDTINHYRRNDDRVFGSRISTLYRIAAAIGVAPVELLPSLARKPRSGLLQDAGFDRKPPASRVKKARNPEKRAHEGAPRGISGGEER